MQAGSDDEILATSRRIFIFAALGAGVLALLGSVSALLFMFLRDLLEVSLSLDTLNDMTEPISIIAAAAAFLPYYWSVYRQDQDAAPEIMPEDSPVISEPVEGQTPRKPVTLLAADDANALIGQIQDALGYDIDTLRWADADAVMPALTAETAAQVAQSITDAQGRYILIIPRRRAVARAVPRLASGCLLRRRHGRNWWRCRRARIRRREHQLPHRVVDLDAFCRQS